MDKGAAVSDRLESIYCCKGEGGACSSSSFDTEMVSAY